MKSKRIIWVSLLAFCILLMQMTFLNSATAEVNNVEQYSQAANPVLAKAKKAPIDRKAPARPNVDTVYDNSTCVTGKAESGSKVTVKSGKKELGNCRADSKGAFTVPIMKQKAGTVISVTATDAAGNTSKPKNVTVIASGVVNKPAAKLIFTFDDGWNGALTAAAPILAKAGFKGTAYVCKNSITSQWGWDLGVMNISDLDKLYNSYGWDISNHTLDHYDRFRDPNQTVEQQINQYIKPLVQDYLDNQNWLLQNGWTRGAYHAAYPSGYYSMELIDYLKGIGVKTARTVNYGLTTAPVEDPQYGCYLLPVQFVEDGNAASVKAYIDKAVSLRETGILMIHKVEDNPGDLVITTSDFQQIVDYAQKYVNSSQLEVLTMSEWYYQMNSEVSLEIGH